MQSHEEIALEHPSLKGYMWSQRRPLAFYLFWRAISVIVVVPFTLIAQLIVDDAIPARDYGGVIFYTLISLGLLVVHFLSMRLSVDSLSIQLQAIMRQLRAGVFYKLNFMHFGFLDSTQTGRLLSKYAIDTNNIEFTLILTVTGILPELLRAGLLILSLAYINLWLLLIALVSIPLFAAVRFGFFRSLEQTNHGVRLAREKMTGQANEFISAIKLVRGYGQEQTAHQQLDELSNAYSEERVVQMRLNQGIGYTLFSVITAITILSTGFSAWLVIEGQLSMGAMIALVGALPVCLYPVNMIAQFSIQYMLGGESYRSIKELIDSRYVEAWKGEQRLKPMRGEVMFENVSFRYEDDNPMVIWDFSTTVQAGEHVAFVGHSGSGKSTLMGLMLGFYASSKGKILVDGVPQSDLDIRHFRRNCAIVMQDNLLLSGSLIDNIRFGRPEATMDEVRQAAKDANALEFIESLPDGFETKVGERGVTLSGGQRQRIAIARALLRNPRILIFDEATSALDYESERLVQEAIDRLSKGRTTITIAHRLSTIRHADRIIVLKDGVKTDEGTWEELAAHEGAFKELLNAQN